MCVLGNYENNTYQNFYRAKKLGQLHSHRKEHDNKIIYTHVYFV